MANNEAQKINLCRYEVSALQITINGEVINTSSLIKRSGIVDIPEYRVKEIEIIEDFERNVFPIFKLVLIVESSVYKKIIKSKNMVNVTLVVDKYLYDIDGTNKRLGGRFLDEKLQLVMNDNIEDLMYTQKLQANYGNMKNAVNDDMHDLQMVDNAIEMYLFKSDSIDKTKSSNSNVILKNVTVTDAIGYLAKTANIERVLMSPPDNIENYEVLLIPPLSILKAFLYIDIYYGLYKTGSLIYFGIDRTYILKYTGESTAWSDGEERLITITIPRTDSSFKSAVLGQTSSNNFIGDYHTIDISNDSIANNYISGNGSQFVDSYTGEIYSSTGNAFNKNTNYLRLLENRTENEYLTTMYTKQSEGNSIVVTVNLQDIDVSQFTPNKMYKLSFEDSSIASRYDGNFILSYAKHSFINTGKGLTVNTQIILKRLNPSSDTSSEGFFE